MPKGLEITKAALDDFKKIQEYMLLAKEENATKTYAKLKDEYLTLKAILNVAGLNLTDIQMIRIDQSPADGKIQELLLIKPENEGKRSEIKVSVMWLMLWPQNLFPVPLYVETFHRQIWAAAKKQGRDKVLRRPDAGQQYIAESGDSNERI